MTPRERAIWMRVQRRANQLSPSMARDLLNAWDDVRESLSDAELARLVTSGDIDQVLNDALLDRAFIPLREKLRDAIERGFKGTVPDLPKNGTVDGQLAVAFDHLDPNVITAVRALDTQVIQDLKSDLRDMIRAYIENGIRDGVNPRTIARQIRGAIGIGPTQTDWVASYRQKLLDANRPAAQVERMVSRYQDRIIARNAEAVARSATLDSLKLGQHLSWQDAINNGIVDPSRLMKRWVGVMDNRERPEHVAMEGEEVPHDSLYSNGEMIPGDSTYNCRCISRFFVANPLTAA